MQPERQLAELLVEEIRLDQKGRFHVATNLSRDGAVLISSEPSEGKSYLWLRFDLPQGEEFVPVLAEVIYERRLGQLYYRGVRYKHVFEQHRAALYAYFDRLAVQSPMLREVSNG